MKLGGIASIAWDRRLVVLVPLVCSLLGGVVVILTFPPRYEATNRVVLDIVKPDPITGFSVSSKNLDAYIGSQVSLIRGDQVAARVVDYMGWADNPDMQAAWAASADKGQDFRHWAAKNVIIGTGADLIPETNILLIKYQATTRDMARVIADNIRTAYIEETVGQQRQSSLAGAQQLSSESKQLQDRLLQLQLAKAALERESGIVSAEGFGDADTRFLRGLIRTIRPDVRPRAAAGGAGLSLELAQMDAAIASATQVLGPNNPALQGMRAHREKLATKLPSRQVRTSGAGAGGTGVLVTKQVDKIISQDDQALALRLLQDEIDQRRKTYLTASGRSGALMELANLGGTSLTPIGMTTVTPAAKFPSYPLILGGAGGLGLSVGLLLAFLLEALARRVREATDLTSIGAPILETIPRYAPSPTKRAKVRPAKAKEDVARRPRWSLRRAKPVNA